jgi:hypothetical protein
LLVDREFVELVPSAPEPDDLSVATPCSVGAPDAIGAVVGADDNDDTIIACDNKSAPASPTAFALVQRVQWTAHISTSTTHFTIKPDAWRTITADVPATQYTRETAQEPPDPDPHFSKPPWKLKQKEGSSERVPPTDSPKAQQWPSVVPRINVDT